MIRAFSGTIEEWDWEDKLVTENYISVQSILTTIYYGGDVYGEANLLLLEWKPVHFPRESHKPSRSKEKPITSFSDQSEYFVQERDH